ncbi:hypothetical protein [Acinetobacter sp.]|uniref:hypothetical protein n=1 Tax=Acinetobacter sp. TaxID=472 RepID=UPI0028AF5765|nr:hypothetical protein [Acinetobacter sp.]
MDTVEAKRNLEVLEKNHSHLMNYNATAQVRQTETDEYETIGKHVIRLTSTTKATVQQITEYLNYVHDFAVTRLGVFLTVLNDLKWCYEDGLN